MHKDNMSRAEMSEDELDERIEQVLQRQPAVQIDANFATRVIARLPRREIIAARQPVTARKIAFAAAFLLLLAMATVVPRSGPASIVSLTMEYSFCAEFLALAVWLGLTPRSST